MRRPSRLVEDHSSAPITVVDLEVQRIGPASHPSPLRNGYHRDLDGDAVLVSSLRSGLDAPAGDLPAFELAGPRQRLFFNASEATVGIVTCGGLCPGLNDVIRSVVMTAVRRYGVRRVLGFRYGFAGVAHADPAPLELTPDVVDDIHRQGGTLLGASRGPQSPAAMVDRLVEQGVDALICVGGDGTFRGAGTLAEEISRRNLPIAIVAVPKTIDNDVCWVERSFGFVTAVQEAGRSIEAAHAEARGGRHGVGLVKLMGRQAGFIAAHAALAFADVNFCLVPEVPFGPAALLTALTVRLRARGHAVVVVAEGAGQELLSGRDEPDHDASGNVRLGDIGPYLRDLITTGLVEAGFAPSVKYLDPSYAIRSRPANAHDAELAAALGINAVHAAMAGRTDLMIGYWNQQFTHVPLQAVIGRSRRLDPRGEVWQRVLQATGQPPMG